MRRQGRGVPTGFARALRTLLTPLLLLTCTAPVLAETAGSLEGRVQEHRLANGLTVLALRRPGAPTVSLQMTFVVGGVDEQTGRTGVAHLLEHMLFKGTTRLGTRDWSREAPLLENIEAVGTALDAERRKGESADREKVSTLAARLAELQKAERELVVKDEIDGIYSQNGAVGFNAATSADMTSYTVSLPSNRLELWARIESERMRDPVLREYYSEREVVAEERRERYETDPDGKLYGSFLAGAFAAHPYRNPVIGWPSDLETLDIEDTREFYRSHYGPDNAVVVAVGEVDPGAFFALVDRYFGALKARGKPARWVTAEPDQAGPKSVEVDFDAAPKVILAWHKPTLPHRDDYVFDVIDSLLSDGPSSRLPRELVQRQRVAASVGTASGIPGARYPNLFAVFATPLDGVEPEKLVASVEAELQRLGTEPPTGEELAKVVRRLEASRVRRLVSNAVLAGQLAYFQAVAGDWRYMEEHARVLSTVTPEEVSAVARKYFRPENRTLALLRPAPKGKSP